MAGVPLLVMRGIGKSFGGVSVLRDVSLTLDAGEVLALMGENGAGKSTLMNILGGIHPDHEGTIEIEGRAVALATPRAATDAGIAFIHQELNLVPELSVADNIFLGREPRRAGFVIDTRRMHEEAAALLLRLEFRLRPDSIVGSLRVGEQQLVEIAKALSLEARILIMDEPTSALSQSETEALFRVVRALAARGVAIIYITHRMEEVFRVADRVLVLRDGAAVGELPAAGAPRRELIRLMTGRDLAESAAGGRIPGRVVLEVEGLWLEQPGRTIGRLRTFEDVSFAVHEGEILGIGGLLGAGRTELLEALFGAAQGRSGGVIRIDGAPVVIDSPQAAKRAGLALVSEDRRREGLVLQAGLDRNVAVPTQPALARAGVVSRARELALATGMIRRLAIRATSPVQPVGALSGGNQQKVVFGKWLPTRPRVLLLDEPTRGIDVGAKAEIYRLLGELAGQGMAIVMVSSELPELLALADRILVLREGRIAARLERAEFSAERVLAHASPSYAAAGGIGEQRERS